MGTSYPDHALEILRAKGYRITEPRRRVLEFLDQAEQPASPYEIKDALGLDVASIYRILGCLEENGLIHRVLATGKVRKCHLDEDHCDRHQSSHCHHHLVCRVCGAIAEFHCTGMDAIQQAIATESGFRVDSHRLELVGVCQDCA